jgi:hypothetical protein
MAKTPHIVIEIVHAATDAVVVCDTLAHCLSCDDGLAEEADGIVAALDRGEFYNIGRGAAEGFVIRPAPQAAWQFYAA